MDPAEETLPVEEAPPVGPFGPTVPPPFVAPVETPAGDVTPPIPEDELAAVRLLDSRGYKLAGTRGGPAGAPPPPFPATTVPAEGEVSAQVAPKPLPQTPKTQIYGALAAQPDAVVDPAVAAERAAIGAAEQANLAEKGAAAQKVAEIEAESAQRKAEASKLKEQRIAQVTEQAQSRVMEAMAARDARVAEFEETRTITDYFSTQTTGDKVVAGMALALGAFGAGLSAAGGRPTGNLAAEQLQRNIDNDFRRQRANVQSASDAVNMARAKVQDAVEARKELLANLDAQEQAAWATIERESIAKLKALGADDARIAQDALVLTARRKQLEVAAGAKRQAELDQLNRLRIEAAAAKDLAEAAQKNTGQDKPPTDVQIKYHGAFESMRQDEDTLQGVGGVMSPKSLDATRRWMRTEVIEDAARNSAVGASASLLADLARVRTNIEAELSKNDPSGKDLTAFQAARRMAMTELRLKSGASIAMHEYQKWEQAHLPVSGDGPKQIEEKRRARETLLKTYFQAGAPGHPAWTMQPPAGAAPAPAADGGGLAPIPGGPLPKVDKVAPAPKKAAGAKKPFDPAAFLGM